MTVRQAAADELANRLKKAADDLAAGGVRTERLTYGRGRAGRLIRPHSPRGFVLDSSGPQILLPDGRLWVYHRRRTAEGLYYDARVDHERSRHGSIPCGDARFSFLGAVVQKYSFGYRHSGDSTTGFELGAMSGQVGSTQFVAADEALADIVDTLIDAAKN